MVSPWSLSYNKSLQISRALLSTIADLDNAAVWMVSASLISKYSTLFAKHFPSSNSDMLIFPFFFGIFILKVHVTVNTIPTTSFVYFLWFTFNRDPTTTLWRRNDFLFGLYPNYYIFFYSDTNIHKLYGKLQTYAMYIDNNSFTLPFFCCFGWCLLGSSPC